MENYQMIAKTLTGLENVLIEEIKQIGGTNVVKRKRAVEFEGNDEIMIKANLALRTAISVLVPIIEFKVRDEFELYDEVFAIQWEEIFGLKDTFSLSATVSGELFTHSKYVALKTKDAIVDRFRQKFGSRPNVDTESADYQFNVHIQYNQCTISLNSSGENLNKRGYRLSSNEAPLNEVLAAGMILKSGWKPEIDFYDPMSGSGTFGIEAALIAKNIPPGINRNFGFQNWADYDPYIFNQLKEEFQSGISSSDSRIYCRDLLTENIEHISTNASKAAVDDILKIKREDFFQSEKVNENGIVFFNPPYGERLQIEQINQFYKKIGDQLKQKYTNCEAWILSSNLDALKYFGLKPESREQMFNGGLECRLNHYKLY